jgi:hypothetical protein
MKVKSLVYFLSAMVCLAETTYRERVSAYLVENGQAGPAVLAAVPRRIVLAWDGSDFSGRILRWNVPGVPEPTEETLPSTEAAEIILADYADAKETAAQAAKPLGRRVLENQFFELSETILTLMEDERAGQTPPIKLGFEALGDLLDTMSQGEAFATSVSLSLKLLSIDAALKRYEMRWWEDATYHDLGE